MFFLEQFRKLINRNGYKIIGYSLDIMRQTACLAVYLITIDSYTFLFNCRAAVQRFGPQTQCKPVHKAFIGGLGLDAMTLVRPAVVQLLVLLNSEG